MNIEVNGKSISLTQSDYVAQGGQACVYKKHSTAYKIYHNPSDLIPTGKIDELSRLKIPNVLTPIDIIYDKNNAIGFTMRYVKDTEFLCKLFTKSFRDKNGITPQDINALVKIMQDTLFAIHAKDVLGVDLNQMNFLTNKKFEDVYFIDADSYETKSYPATALMDSVRDRQVKNNKWTKNSDWFSWGVTVFELYTGVHPYKGRCNDFAPKDWMQMMDKNISIFNSKCRMPPATQPLSVIPKGHLKWFEAIFEKGERIPPPQPDQVTQVIQKPKAQIVRSNASFNIEIIQKTDSHIQCVRWIDGIMYTKTSNKIFANDRIILEKSEAPLKGRIYDFAPIRGGRFPVLIKYDSTLGKLEATLLEKNTLIETVDTSGFFTANNLLYYVVGESLLESAFLLTSKKAILSKNIVANVFHNHTTFDGIIIQNMIGTCRFCIPFEAGKCAIIHAKELDKCRIIDAKYKAGFAIVIAESGGKNYRFVFIFNKQHSSYTIRQEKLTDLVNTNFTVKDNGVCIAENGDWLEAFITNDKVKQFASPLNGGETLMSYKNDIYVMNDDELLKIASK